MSFQLAVRRFLQAPSSVIQINHFVVLALSYAMLGYVGIQLANLSYGISLIWPPIGVAIALLLRWGLYLWPAIVIGGLGLQLLVSDFSLLQAFILALGSALIIVLHCAWLQKTGFDRRLEQVADMLRFVAIAIISCSAILALFGISLLIWIGRVPAADLVTAWSSWFLGDVTGVLIFGLALLIFERQKLAVLFQPKNLLALGLMLVLSAEIFIFNQTGLGVALTLLPMICLLWIAMRTNLVVTSWVVLCFSSLAIYSVYLNAGIFATLANPTMGTWLYMASLGLVSLILSVSAAEARLNAELMRHAIAATQTGIWDLRLDDKMLFLNAHLLQNLGHGAYPRKQPLPEFNSLIHVDDRVRLQQEVQAYLLGDKPQLKLIVRLQHQDGSWRDQQLEGAVTERDLQGEPMRLSGTVIDVTEQQQLQAKLNSQAMTDELTGVANRRAFMQHLTLCWRQYQRDHRLAFYLILIDLDYFKKINDQYGHDAGDKVLQGFSQLVSGRLRQTDYFARLGGEEFVILARAESEADILALAEQLRQAVNALSFDVLTQPEFNISASFGIAGCAVNIQSAEELLKYADQALYQAKARGRNQVVSFQPDERSP
jgi:diguanylate cyclase (GGDEF)-like protein